MMREFNLGNSKKEVLELLPERKVKKIRLGVNEIGVMRIGEEVFGFELFCPHRGASLVNAYPNNSGDLICPLHEYRFDLKSGQVKSGSCSDLKVYSCQLTENGLIIRLD
jgi:nitrite reductase/ring-hydroxylating ferredoxin subunit